jgi:hypothetical protein
MAKIRLVALDMDGTLLNDRQEISPRNAAAIRRALDAGVIVCLATGRGVQNVLPYTELLDLTTPMITVNGGEIWHRPHELHRRTAMDAADVLRLRRLALEHGVWYWAYATDGVYNRERWVEPEEAAERKVWLKFGYYEENERLLERIRATAESWGGFEISNSSTANIELNPAGVSKGAALRELCGLLGIDPSETAAAGDSLNDLSMIRAAGLGAAMGGAQQPVKEAADIVLPGNNEDGIAHLIEHHVLGR